VLALTLVCAGGYDGSVLSITVPGRSIDLAEVRDAATAIYGAAVRTPLVRLDLSDAGSPSELYLTLEVLQTFGSFQIASFVGACGQSLTALSHRVDCAL
jgi:threonine dehydratase